MNDLLEELVGDLEDDISVPEEQPMIERIDSKTWRIRGVAPLDMVSEQLGIALPDDVYGTFGGLVFGSSALYRTTGVPRSLRSMEWSLKLPKSKTTVWRAP
jgi:putative hemolysin